MEQVLENYFDILIDKKSNSPICVDGIAYKLHELYFDIKENYTGNQFQKLLKEKHITGLYSWKSGYFPIPITKLKRILVLWQNICKKSDYEVQLVWDELFYEAEKFTAQKSQIRINVIKFLDEELAYLLGILYSDGSLRNLSLSKLKRRRYDYEITITDHKKENIVQIVNLFNKKFGINTNVKAVYQGKWYRLLFSSLILHRFFNKLFEMPQGYKKGKLRVPELIKNAPELIQRNFILGVFDGDGMCTKSLSKKGYYSLCVSLSQATKEFLDDIQEILQKINISMRIYKKISGNNIYYVLETKSKKTIKEFYEKINFNYKNKKEKLQKIIDLI